jgi:leader peptidase (prepilin peptidase)/N-methyltransferase
MEQIWPVLLALIGLAVGSFLNVLISRLPESRSILGRSRCESCGKQISNIHNIPIISYLFLQGKCSTCDSPIGKRHLIIEILVPLLYVSGYFLTNQPIEILIWINLVNFGLPLAIIDLKFHRLPNVLTYTFFASNAFLIFIAAIHSNNLGILISAIIQSIALFVFYLILRVISKGGMGVGDAKLGLSIGLISGFFGRHMVFNATYLAFVIGALIAITQILLKKSTRKSKVAFGPYMILGLMLALTYYFSVQLHTNSQFLGNL